MLLFKPLLKLISTLKIRTHLVGLGEACCCFFVKLQTVLNACVDLLQFGKFCLQLVSVRCPGTLRDRHLQYLFSNCNLALQVNFDVQQIKATVVAMLDSFVGLLVQQTLYFVSVLLKFQRFTKLLTHLVDEFRVDRNLFVVFDELFHLLLSAFLIRDHIKLEVFEFVAVFQFHDQICLLLIDSVGLVAYLEALYLPYDVASMIGDS